MFSLHISKNENPMNLNALSLFVSVVQDGSLSKVSERLNVPIATISRQITELEKSLNIQLFDRKKIRR